jgi:hypothetical protein
MKAKEEDGNIDDDHWLKLKEKFFKLLESLFRRTQENHGLHISPTKKCKNLLKKLAKEDSNPKVTHSHKSRKK